MFFAIEVENNRIKVEELYNRYCKLMYKEAYSILNDKHLSEDAVSESFVRIIKNLHKIESCNSPRTCNFLIILCRNVAKNIYNKQIYLNKSDSNYFNI